MLKPILLSVSNIHRYYGYLPKNFLSENSDHISPFLKASKITASWCGLKKTAKFKIQISFPVGKTSFPNKIIHPSYVPSYVHVVDPVSYNDSREANE